MIWFRRVVHKSGVHGGAGNSLLVKARDRVMAASQSRTTGYAQVAAPPVVSYCPSSARTRTLLIQNVAEQKKCVTGASTPRWYRLERGSAMKTAAGWPGSQGGRRSERPFREREVAGSSPVTRMVETAVTATTCWG